MLGLCNFIFTTFSNEKVFTVTVNVTVTRVPPTFAKLAKIWKIIFLNNFLKKLLVPQNIYQNIGTRE